MPTYGAALIYKNQRIFSVGVVFFDLLLSESHNFSNTVTTYNVESGGIISDNIKNELESPTVSGLISNFSIRENIIDPEGVISQQTGLSDLTRIDRAQIAFEKIHAMWKLRTFVSVLTFYKLYTSVVITNISINNDADSGQGLVANFSFQEIKIVKLKTLDVSASVNLKDMKGSQNKQSALNLDLGKQVGVTR